MGKPEKKDNKYDTAGKKRRTMIGGQALLEGVMMRGKSSVAMAVRAPDGEIELRTERIKPPSKLSRVPIIRGVISFVNSLSVGMSALLKSAEVSAPEEEAPTKSSTVIAVILGVVLAVGLFIALPFFIGFAIDKWTPLHHVGLIALIEGGARIIIFIAYLAGVRLMSDIKRTYMYHGAEHRTINCYEHGLPLTVENVQSCSTKHNRCGTTFLFFVVIFAILVYALTSWLFSLITWHPEVFSNGFFKLLIRLALLPLIAGLSFELLRGLAALPDNKFTNAIRAPGLALQRLSTCIPEDDMAEVAIVAFKAVLELDENENKGVIDFFEREFNAERRKLAEMLKDDPQDADWIFCEILGKSRAELGTVEKIGAAQAKQAREYAERLLAGEPLAYVLGNSDFCGVKIKVDSRVLIPRFETEVLANAATEFVKERGDDARVLDLCTGSGCIAAVLARNTSAEIVASDVSEQALEVAEENLRGLGAEIVRSDMFEEISGEFDLIVSNPPYVRTFEIDGLRPQVTVQPRLALDGGEDGLHFYRIIAEQCVEHLKKNGAVMVEVGYDQADDVVKLFSGVGDCEIVKDLDGKKRIVVCRT